MDLSNESPGGVGGEESAAGGGDAGKGSLQVVNHFRHVTIVRMSGTEPVGRYIRGINDFPGLQGVDLSGVLIDCTEWFPAVE